jgi:hypothetical protein
LFCRKGLVYCRHHLFNQNSSLTFNSSLVNLNLFSKSLQLSKSISIQ